MEHFREGELLPFVTSLTERQAGVLGHLLACPRCRKLARPIAGQLAQTAAGVAPAASAPELDRVWPRLARRWEAQAAAIAAERAAAGPLVDELLALPREQRSLALRTEERFHTAAVVLTLLERGGQAAETQPDAAEELARLALTLLQRLPPGAAARDLQSSGYTLVGQALQRRGEVSSAELAFRTASDLLEEQDSFEAAVLARRLAGFRRAGKRVPEALALYQRAVTLFEECGEAATEPGARRAGHALRRPRGLGARRGALLALVLAVEPRGRPGGGDAAGGPRAAPPPLRPRRAVRGGAGAGGPWRTLTTWRSAPSSG